MVESASFFMILVLEGAIMDRYSKITQKFPREIVLLKSKPCKWGRCSFCDYIDDNSLDKDEINQVNEEVLGQVTGEYGVLEVINSGNIFELPNESLDMIKEIIKTKEIKQLYVEAHWIYRKKIQAFREMIGIPVRVKTGLESFHREFREEYLIKGFDHEDIDQLKQYFDSVCLLVGIEGQTKDMIRQDISLAKEHFEHFTVNLFVDNSTEVKADKSLQKWFREEFHWLETEASCEILWVNTDFGVGE